MFDNLLCKPYIQLYGYDACNSTDILCINCDCIHILGMLL